MKSCVYFVIASHRFRDGFDPVHPLDLPRGYNFRRLRAFHGVTLEFEDFRLLTRSAAMAHAAELNAAALEQRARTPENWTWAVVAAVTAIDFDVTISIDPEKGCSLSVDDLQFVFIKPRKAERARFAEYVRQQRRHRQTVAAEFVATLRERQAKLEAKGGAA